MQPCCRIMIGECTNLVPFKVVCQEALPIHSLSIQSGFLSLNITTIQKQLEQEHRALDMKFKFITELKALMEKYNQSGSDLLAILNEAGTAAPATRRRTAAGRPRTQRKRPQRPLRQFRHPQTGEVVEARAPQVNKTIRGWAESLQVDWRELEVK